MQTNQQVDLAFESLVANWVDMISITSLKNSFDLKTAEVQKVTVIFPITWQAGKEITEPF